MAARCFRAYHSYSILINGGIAKAPEMRYRKAKEGGIAVHRTRRPVPYRKRDNPINVITYLTFLKTCFLLFLGGDILLFAFHHRLLGVILLFSGLFLMWRLYRCPVCKCPLDGRMSLRKMNCCPCCGCDFTAQKMGRGFRNILL